MSLPAGATTSSTTNFSTSRYAQQIRRELLEFGPQMHVFRQLADVGKLEPGHSLTYQVNRRRRIPIPTASATEGVPPNPTSLGVDNVSGTAAQYVIVTQFTDVAEIVQFHDLLQDAEIEVKDAMARLDDKIISDSFVAGTNIVYPGSITGIANITAADTLSTLMVRRASAALRLGSTIFGSAPRFAGNKHAAIVHVDSVMDIQADATWDQYASRQRPELLEKGIINDWEGIYWYESNFMPEYTNIGTTEAGISGGGLTSADGGAGGTWTGGALNGTQSYVVVKKNVFRTFTEAISGVLTSASITSGHKFQLTLPADAGATSTYLYDIYFPISNGSTTLKLVSSNNASGAVVLITDYPASTAAVAPTAPAANVTVLPTFFCGKGAVSSVDLSPLEVFITPRVATPSDPAVQNRYVSAKMFLGSFLQQNQWLRVGYSATSMAGILVD